MKKQLKIALMIHDTIFPIESIDIAKQYEDGKDVVKVVYVGINENETIDANGENANNYNGWIFDDAIDAINEINEYNK